MGKRGNPEMRDPKVIPIGPWLTPTLLRESSATEATVIPIRPGMLPRPSLRRRTPRAQVWLAGICWIAIVLL